MSKNYFATKNDLDRLRDYVSYKNYWYDTSPTIFNKREIVYVTILGFFEKTGSPVNVFFDFFGIFIQSKDLTTYDIYKYKDLIDVLELQVYRDLGIKRINADDPLIYNPRKDLIRKSNNPTIEEPIRALL